MSKFNTPKISLRYRLSFDKFRQTLPRVQQETFCLFCYEGLSISDIAKKTGKTRQSVSKNISIIQQKLNELGTAQAINLFKKLLKKKGLEVERQWHLKKVRNRQTKFLSRKMARQILKEKQ